MIKLSTMRKPEESPLQQVYNLLEFDGGNDALLTGLYNSLSPVKIPSNQHLRKNALNWLDSATNSKDVRPFLKYLHASDGWLVATDGHRLHALSSGLDGTFETVKKGKALELSKVNTEAFSARAVEVFKRYQSEALKNIDSGLLLSNWGNQKVYKGDVYIGIEDSKGKTWFYSYKYLHDAINLVESISINISDDGALLLSITAHQKAVIMPANID